LVRIPPRGLNFSHEFFVYQKFSFLISRTLYDFICVERISTKEIIKFHISNGSFIIAMQKISERTNLPNFLQKNIQTAASLWDHQRSFV
jgi:hypothetical protein